MPYLASCIKWILQICTHTYTVGPLILLIFALLPTAFLRFILESWYVNSADYLKYWVHISLDSGHCVLICIHSQGTGNWHVIHWSWQTGVSGRLWLLLFGHIWYIWDTVDAVLHIIKNNLSPFDSNIACLCQCIEIYNNRHVYRQSQVRKPTGSGVEWAECLLIIGTGCRVQVFSLILDSSVDLSAGIQFAGE